MAHNWRIVSVALSLGLCVICSAQVCTVTKEAGQFLYRATPVTASDCEYSWSNATGSRDTVLAHQGGGRDEVKSNNISTLITSECFDHIIYKCKCISPDVYFQVNCTTACNVKPALLEMDETYRLYVGTAIALLLLLVVVVVGVLINRKRISNYDSVKTEP